MLLVINTSFILVSRNKNFIDMILGRFNKHNKGKYVATWISLGSENKSERWVLLRKIMRAKPIESPVWDIMDKALILGLKELFFPFEKT